LVRTKSGRSRISLISSISESVSQMVQFAPATISADCDHIETNRQFAGASAIRENFRGFPNPILLARIDRRLGDSGAIRHARFHFDENQGATIHYYDIDLGARSAKISRHDFVASPSQMPRCRMLAASPI
jgi:hypothetical protein